MRTVAEGRGRLLPDGWSLAAAVWLAALGFAALAVLFDGFPWAAPAVAAGLLAWRLNEAARAELRALRERDERFRQAFDHAPTGMAIADRDGRIERANAALATLVGCPVDELAGVPVQALCEPWEDGRLPAIAPGQGEWRLRGAGDRLVWALVSLTRVDAKWFVQVTDLTGRREAETRVRGLLEAAPGALVGCDASGAILHANSGAELLFATTREALAGESVCMLVPRAHRPRLMAHFDAVLRDGVSAAPLDLHAQRFDGALFPVEVRMSTLHSGETGTLIVVTFSDLTDRRRAEEALRHLAAVLAASDEAIVSATPSGVIRSWNPAAERLLGYSAREAIGQPLLMLVAEEDAERERAHLERAARGERMRGVTHCRRRDGTPIELDVAWTAAADDAGRVDGVTLVARPA